MLALKGTALQPYAAALQTALTTGRRQQRHGKQEVWNELVAEVQIPGNAIIELDDSCVGFGDNCILEPEQHRRLEEALQGLVPWRKGPFSFFGQRVDTEWRSDWKWDRLKGAIQPLQDRMVLDVGCGSGYHCWRMRGEGARVVIGLEPTPIYVHQFGFCKRFAPKAPVFVLPIPVESLPLNMSCFDTIFSMGLLYHLREPLKHLQAMLDALRPGGEFVMETLVVEGALHEVLIPEGRYAQMRNVFQLPSVATLVHWMENAGFEGVRVVDVTTTTLDEQRTTKYMPFFSLEKFLDANDRMRTVEGHPKPVRAIVLGNRPNDL